MTFKVKRLSATAKLPVRSSQEAAGYDLTACLLDEQNQDRTEISSDGQITLLPGERALIPTGLAFTTPEGTYGRIGPRSGLAYKHGLDTLAGIVDRDYTSEAGVILINLGQEPFTVEHGMRIAQLVLEKIETPDVEEVDTLDDTQRGQGGFGSTGL